jgi:hypothetical protein
MHPRTSQLFGLIGVLILAAGCGDPPLAPVTDQTSLAQGGPEPRAPSDLNAVPSATQISLTWQDNSPNENGFEVHRSPQLNGTYSLVTTTAANIEGYVDGGRTAGTTSCYKVRAVKRSGSKTTFSTFAGPTCATTLVPPTAALEATAVPQGSTSIIINWRESSSDESGFWVERGPGQAGPWTIVATTGPNVTYAQDVVSTDVPVCYRIVAFHVTNGPAQPSNIDCTAAPAAPVNLRAEPADEPNTIDLAWDRHPPDPAPVNDGYQIQRLDLVVWQWSEIAILPADATTYSDVGLTGEIFWYLVRATKDGGYSDYSQVQVLLGPPTAPSNLVAYPLSSTSAVVYWADNSVSEDGFRLQRGPSEVGPWETIAETWTDYPYFEDYGLATEEQVCYQVMAFNSKGPSTPSPADCTAPPAAPTGLAATTVDHQSINLAWDAVPDTKDGHTVRDGYWVYRLEPYGYYTFIAELGADATNFPDTGLESATEYTYLVLALNDGDPNYGSRGNSDWSTLASATTDPAPGTTSVTAASPRPNAAAVRGEAARALTRALRSRLPVQHPVSPASRKPPPPK